MKCIEIGYIKIFAVPAEFNWIINLQFIEGIPVSHGYIIFIVE